LLVFGGWWDGNASQVWNSGKESKVMRIDIQKLDDRIKKLQEIRRIAANPELAMILLEFMDTEDAVSEPVLVPNLEDVSTPRVDSTHELVKEVVAGTNPEARDGLWSRKR
jgi:hypothetical protein